MKKNDNSKPMSFMAELKAKEERKRKIKKIISWGISLILVGTFITAIVVLNTSPKYKELSYDEAIKKMTENSWEIFKTESSYDSIKNLARKGAMSLDIDTEIENLSIQRSEKNNMVSYSLSMIENGEEITNECSFEKLYGSYPMVSNTQLLEEDEFLKSCKSKVKVFLLENNIVKEDSEVIKKLESTKFYLADFPEYNMNESPVANTQEGTIYISKFWYNNNMVSEWTIIHELFHIARMASNKEYDKGGLNEILTEYYTFIVSPESLDYMVLSTYYEYFNLGAILFDNFTLEEINEYYFNGDYSAIDEKMGNNFVYYEELVNYLYEENAYYFILAIINNMI